MQLKSRAVERNAGNRVAEETTPHVGTGLEPLTPAQHGLSRARWRNRRVPLLDKQQQVSVRSTKFSIRRVDHSSAPRTSLVNKRVKARYQEPRLPVEVRCHPAPARCDLLPLGQNYGKKRSELLPRARARGAVHTKPKLEREETSSGLGSEYIFSHSQVADDEDELTGRAYSATARTAAAGSTAASLATCHGSQGG